jgi:hypothetical protein
MASQLHETFLFGVIEEIYNRLRTIADGNTQSSAFAQKIKLMGSGRLYLCNRNDSHQRTVRRHPDLSFKHRDAFWPGVVVEVSYSQKKKALPYLADDYILGTNGSIRVVVGLDIDYKTTKRGTISIWRPEHVTNKQGKLGLKATQTLVDQVRVLPNSKIKLYTDTSQVFRDEFGNPNLLSPNTGLRFDLRDFAPDDLTTDISDSFLIDSATLCRLLEEAEDEERNQEQRQGSVQNLFPDEEKLYREQSPVEEVNAEDEHKFASIERKVQKCLSDDDISYSP